MAQVCETNTLKQSYHHNEPQRPNERMMIRGKINRIPPRVFMFANQVTDLDMSFNMLQSVPKKVKKLKQLKSFSAVANRIAKVSKKIGTLENLTALDLSDNVLSKLPSTFQGLKFAIVNLRQLWLDRNAFTKFPEVICELTQLESLSFEGHQAVCQIPLSLSNLRNLTTLHLAQCCLSEFPETICLLTSLKTLNLAGNFLSSLPKSAKQLTSLQVLNISFNDFSALPKVLKQMKSLDLVLTAGNKTHFVWPIATSKRSLPLSVLQASPKAVEASQILDNLFLGDLESAKHRHFLKSKKVTHIVTLLENPAEFYPALFAYKSILVSDIAETNLLQYFDDTYKWISEAMDEGGSVLVHCFAGISRSSTIVTAFVMRKLGLSADDAMRYVSRRRTIAFPNSGFQNQLRRYGERLMLNKTRHPQGSNNNAQAE